MRQRKRMIAMLLCLIMVGMITGCASNPTSKADVSFSMWIYSSMGSNYYTEYEENPALQYALSKTYGPEGKTVSVDYWMPAAGSEDDNYQTMIGSNSLPDILDGTPADTARTMYEDGFTLDITDYVKEYMPNYLAYLEKYPEVKSSAVDIIDGEEHYLGIWSGFDALDYYYFGLEYRRDWIVKYGTNPVTGASFTGGYTDENDPDSWQDDVVFPSGGSDPLYISDWEWMFEIFEKAQADLGIDDSYCLSMYYPGYTWTGGLCSSFGGGIPAWYADETNTVRFGAVTDSYRTYLQCLNTWFQKGWLDNEFYQRTGDAFYSIDDISVRQGKVGMWTGLEGQLGRRMEDPNNPNTVGICVYGCAYPINDVYGPEECQNVVPDCVQSIGMVGTKYYVTKAAKDKDLATILSFIDYFYSEEGALLLSLGLNAEQVKESDNQFYQKWGLSEGAYTVTEDGTYRLSDVIVNDSGTLGDAVRVGKMPGIILIKNVDQGFSETYEHSLATWVQYENLGCFQGKAASEKMSTEDSKAVANSLSKVLNWLETNTPEMIRGIRDPFKDEDWDVWCKTLAKFKYQNTCDIYQPYVDMYPLR